MNQVLTKYKEQTTDSYDDIAKISGVTYDSVVKCFRDPGGVGANVMIGVCRAIHMPLDDAFKLWMSMHLAREEKTRIEKWRKALNK